MIARCPECRRWIGTYAVRTTAGREVLRRFDLHSYFRDGGSDCPLSDEPVPSNVPMKVQP